jgi:hypothetical protein
LLGSVAEEVVARAPCPVILARASARPSASASRARDLAEDLARAGPSAPRVLGIRTVPVSLVVGSVGRSGELDEQFRIRNQSRLERQRHERVVRAMSRGVTLPPVVLNKLGPSYYVVDGHHRVAAARELGQYEIEAEVTEFVPLGDSRAQRLVAERRAFERSTGLHRVGAARPGTYPRLERLIREFAAERGLHQSREAARRWETEVYRPLAREIRGLRLRERFPGERTADIFLRVAEIRDRESSRRASPVEWSEALARLASDGDYSDGPS